MSEGFRRFGSKCPEMGLGSFGMGQLRSGSPGWDRGGEAGQRTENDETNPILVDSNGFVNSLWWQVTRGVA